MDKQRQPVKIDRQREKRNKAEWIDGLKAKSEYFSLYII